MSQKTYLAMVYEEMDNFYFDMENDEGKNCISEYTHP